MYQSGTRIGIFAGYVRPDQYSGVGLLGRVNDRGSIVRPFQSAVCSGPAAREWSHCIGLVSARQPCKSYQYQSWCLQPVLVHGTEVSVSFCLFVASRLPLTQLERSHLGGCCWKDHHIARRFNACDNKSARNSGLLAESVFSFIDVSTRTASSGVKVWP